MCYSFNKTAKQSKTIYSTLLQIFEYRTFWDGVDFMKRCEAGDLNLNFITLLTRDGNNSSGDLGFFSLSFCF